ncbi:hypothetical protein ACI5JL_000378 [Escherichia coli]|nr:hypothetical protein [Escherichia coli]
MKRNDKILRYRGLN